MIIRNATESDLESLLEITNFYILNSNSSFGEQPLGIETMAPWLGKYSQSGPFRALVAEDHGKVVGTASSNRYRDHVAFSETIEVSIQLAPDVRSRGIGTALYQMLFDELKNENLHRAVAGIALPNDASIALHKKFGFEEVGVFNEYAQKNGQYISSIWMQKKLR